MIKENKYSILYSFVILAMSIFYSWFIFSKPERVNFWILIMLFPGIVALIINIIRFKSVKRALTPLTCKINVKSILFALSFPIVFISLLGFLIYLLELAELSSLNLPKLKLLSVLMLLLPNFILMFGEEYGWRGFLLKELSQVKSKVFATVIVGVVWAAFHAPIVYSLARHYQMDNPGMMCLVQMTAVFVISFPFAHSYYLSGSIIPPMLLHFLWNAMNPMVFGNIYTNKSGWLEGNLMIINGEGFAGIILGCFFVIWFIRSYRHRKK